MLLNFKKLLLNKPEDKYYYASKMKIEVLKDNYPEALSYYKKIKSLSPKYVHPKSHNAFLGFLLNIFENRYVNFQNSENEIVQHKT